MPALTTHVSSELLRVHTASLLVVEAAAVWRLSMDSSYRRIVRHAAGPVVESERANGVTTANVQQSEAADEQYCCCRLTEVRVSDTPTLQHSNTATNRTRAT